MLTRPVASIKPNPKRSTVPTPFAGLTHQAHCALCEQESRQSPLTPLVRPDPMPLTHRRPRTVDTAMHFCPPQHWDYRGWLGLNNRRATGHPRGGPWRQFHCTSCRGYLLETHGTLCHGKQEAVELIVRVLACLAEGLGSAPRLEASRSSPTPCDTGWAQRSSSGAPCPRLSCVISPWSSGHSTSSRRCCVTSKLARAATTKPASAWSARPIGCGRQWTRRASCW